MTSPTQRSLAHWRKAGYFCWITEHWNSFKRCRVDMWGFCDILALGQDEVIAIQTTSWMNVPARVRKIADHENTAAVRKAGIRIIAEGWRKSKLGKWERREVDCS